MTLVSSDGTTYLAANRFSKMDFTLSIKDLAWKSLQQSIFSNSLHKDDLKEITLDDKKGIGLTKQIKDAKNSYDLSIFYYQDGEYYKGIVAKTPVEGNVNRAETILKQARASWTDHAISLSYQLSQEITLPGTDLKTKIPTDWTEQTDQSSDHQRVYLSKDQTIAFTVITAEGTGAEGELYANAESLMNQLGEGEPSLSQVSLAGQNYYQVLYTATNEETNTAFTYYIGQKGTTLMILRFETSPSTMKILKETMEEIVSSVN
ncbi:hypothetical protein STRDD13_00627 [Streptococcus sp. DD13]|nr:hypothetical protein STRDD13_00627 [Streptococcus sp. DD13]